MPMTMTSDTKLVAITGGTGFIGSQLITALLTKGYRVRALIRNTNKLQVKHPSLEITSGDLHQKASLNDLIHEAHYVIHCAGRVRGASQEQFLYDNLESTQNILDACKQASSLKRFIFISSLAAREPNISHYAKSKYLAEELIKSTNFIQWSIIRPPAVYGPGDKELLPVFNWMKKGILWVPGNVEQKFSLIHVLDLVDLITQEIPSLPIAKVLEPDDGCQYDWDLIAQLCSEFFNRKIRKILIPKAVLSSAANLNVLLSSFFNYSPMLTPSKVRELMCNDWIAQGISPSHGWAAQIDLKKGLSTLYSSL